MNPALVVVIGAGPAGLMAAERLASQGIAVRVFDHMPSPARKFLMAGRGGLNLTHSEPLPQFLQRYGSAAADLEPMLRAFPPQALIAWAEVLGQETFVGSSGRVFPKAMKASPLLRAWLRRLEGLGVEIELRRRWLGFDGPGRVVIANAEGATEVLQAGAMLLAMGGASWPKLGSDGLWATALARDGVSVAPLTPSNCGVIVQWSEVMRGRFAGAVLKNAALSCDGVTARGDVVITQYGLEGGAIYALNRQVRAALAAGITARLAIDLRPQMTCTDLSGRLQRVSPDQSLSNRLRKAAALDAGSIHLLRESFGAALKADADALAKMIKSVPVDVTGLAAIARAISSAGGVRWEAVDSGLMLRNLPGVFVAGEMLDWDAPTGGYLLQACFSTAVWAADAMERTINAKL